MSQDALEAWLLTADGLRAVELSRELRALLVKHNLTAATINGLGFVNFSPPAARVSPLEARVERLEMIARAHGWIGA